MAKATTKPEHKERAHALLSASGASRWLACTPSARLEEHEPESRSEYADEGTLAHELSELILRVDLKLITLAEYKKGLAKIKESRHYSDEMQEYCKVYTDYVKEQYNEAKAKDPNAVLLIEQRVDFSHLVPEGYGTGDTIVIGSGLIEVIDLKYGAGLKVEAEDNPQGKLYASGALFEYELTHDLEAVKITIVQPRLDSISSYELSAGALIDWGEDVVKAKAAEAYAGKGELVTGKHCQFCKVSHKCAAQYKNLIEVTKHDFAEVNTLEEAELIEVLKIAGAVQKWLDSVQKFMFTSAIGGKKWDGFKLVDGVSRRAWGDEVKAINSLTEAGYPGTAVTNLKLKGIGEIEKLVGKADFEKIVGACVVKNATSPSLVPETDKRPEMANTTEQASTDFDNCEDLL